MTIYFYKVWQPYGCFSNFSPHGIQIRGTYWPTVEHYYQAQKFVTSIDAVIIPVIHSAPTPEEGCCFRTLSYSPTPSRLGGGENSGDERSCSQKVSDSH